MRPLLPALAALLAGSGCMATTAPPAVQAGAAAPLAGIPPVHLQLEPAGPAPEPTAELAVTLVQPARSAQSLPATWDTATLTLQNSSALTQMRQVTLAKGTGITTSNGGATYVATGTFGTLRPTSGYTLTVDLWQGGSGGNLVAENQVPVSLVAGANNVTVSTNLYTFGFTSVAPTAAGSGDTVVLTGGGFSILPWQDQVTLNGTTAPFTWSSATSLSAKVPDIGPSDTTVSWQVQVGTSVASVAGFTVLGILGSPNAWATTADQEQSPSIAWGSNRYLTAWLDASDHQIDGAMVSSSGAVLVSSFGISPTGLPPTVPKVAYDSTTNQWLATFQTSADGGDIDGQLVNPDGSLSGSMIAICNYAGSQKNQAVAYDSVDNRFLSTWTDARTAATSIYGSLVSAGGVAGSNLAIASDTYNMDDSAVAFDASASKYLVVWDEAQSKKVIQGTILNSDGSVAVAPFTIASNASNDQTIPKVAWDSDSGDFMVVWLNNQGSGVHYVMGQRVSVSGSLVGGTDSISTVNFDKNNPHLAYQTWRKKFLITWDDKRSSTWEVFGQHMAIDGTMWGGNFHVTSDSSNDQNNAVAIDATDQKGMVAYQNAANGGDVYGQEIR